MRAAYWGYQTDSLHKSHLTRGAGCVSRQNGSRQEASPDALDQKYATLESVSIGAQRQRAVLTCATDRVSRVGDDDDFNLRN